MDDVAIDTQAERIVRSLAISLTYPRPGDCLFCYVARMLGELGCDNTLRFAAYYRDRSAPRATSLEQRLGDMGGFCDCEIFLNAMTVAPYLRGEDEDGNEIVYDAPEVPRGQAGVHAELWPLGAAAAGWVSRCSLQPRGRSIGPGHVLRHSSDISGERS